MKFDGGRAASFGSYQTMGTAMAAGADELLELLRHGDPAVLGEVFDRHRDRLKRMVRLRLDRRLQGRVDASDVLQETFVDLANRLKEYLDNPRLPFFLWLRLLTGQRLLMVHRHHLGTQMRDAALEISLQRGQLPPATSVSLAAQLLGHLTTPTQAAQRAEMQARLQEALNTLDPLDREILALRHFEELTNNEVAQLLNLQKSAASNRYIRALKRLKDVLRSIPGFFPE